jgi:hypothetical protein
MRDIHLRFGIDRSTCEHSHLSLVSCESLQVIIHKGDTELVYEISPIHRESHEYDFGLVKSMDFVHGFAEPFSDTSSANHDLW